MRLHICAGIEPDGTRCSNPTSAARCPRHADFTTLFKRQGSTSRLYQTRAWQRLRKSIVDDWVREHGHVCPGYRVEAHESRDLVVDHALALRRGGAALDRANLRVLCRRCNSRKSLRADRA